MLNVEIKARIKDPELVEMQLVQVGAVFHGTDFQKDIYYQVNKGRLKLRKGNIENSLIYYERANQKEAKSSFFELTRLPANTNIEQVLAKVLEVKVIVEKKRKIFYWDNLKIHIDFLKELGHFVEIEARDMDGRFTENELQLQCLNCQKLLDIRESDLLSTSYSDMLLA